MGNRLPGPILEEDRLAAVDIHQLRAGHWSCSERYLHRIGRRPTPGCERCNDVECPGCPMPGLQGGGGHTAPCSAPVPGAAGGASPAVPGHHQPGGDRRQRRRRGGGLGLRLPRPTEPPRLRPVRDWGEQQQQGLRVRIPVVALFFLSL